MVLPFVLAFVFAASTSPDVTIMPRQDVWVSPRQDLIVGDTVKSSPSTSVPEEKPLLLVKTPQETRPQFQDTINLQALAISVGVMVVVAALGLKFL